jgi:hypothetical protein
MFKENSMNPLVNLESFHESLPGCIAKNKVLIAQKGSGIGSLTGEGADLERGIVQLDIDKLESEVKILEEALAILDRQARLGPFRRPYSSHDESVLQTAWQIWTGCALSTVA